jgi:N-acetylglucosaminyldiphosphoundecaprenol N-acetyl-beta-D-mannosaminyltransferase
MSKLTLDRAGHSTSGELQSFNVHLLGRRITFMTVPGILKAVHAACRSQDQILVANYNVHSFNLSMQLPWFYDFLQSAEITHCDGMGILKAVRYLGVRIPSTYRVSYTSLMPELLEHCNQHGFSIFLLGAKHKNLEAAVSALQAQYPNIRVEGHHGYFDSKDPDQSDEIVQQINQFKPNVLIVGMGMPVQEDWVHRNRDRLKTNVILPGGAVIDRLAGMVPDCPAFLSNLGLEWLYRLSREPKRLAVRYLVGNVAFVLHIVLAMSCMSRVELVQTRAVSESGSVV